MIGDMSYYKGWTGRDGRPLERYKHFAVQIGGIDRWGQMPYRFFTHGMLPRGFVASYSPREFTEVPDGSR